MQPFAFNFPGHSKVKNIKRRHFCRKLGLPADLLVRVLFLDLFVVLVLVLCFCCVLNPWSARPVPVTMCDQCGTNVTQLDPVLCANKCSNKVSISVRKLHMQKYSQFM